MSHLAALLVIAQVASGLPEVKICHPYPSSRRVISRECVSPEVIMLPISGSGNDTVLFKLESAEERMIEFVRPDTAGLVPVVVITSRQEFSIAGITLVQPKKTKGGRHEIALSRAERVVIGPKVNGQMFTLYVAWISTE